MKKISRILSFILAITMVLSLNLTAITALADEPTSTTYTITINNTTTGYSYAAYQIFDGDLSGSTQGEYVLSNIEWGSGVSTDTKVDEKTLIEAIQAISYTPDGETVAVTPFKDCTTAAEVAAVLSTSPYNTADSEVAQKFAEVVSKYLSSSVTYSEEKTKTEDDGQGNTITTTYYTISVSDPGYYLVQNAASSGTGVPTAGAYTRYILEVVGDVSVNPKSDVPTVDKKVQDVDDSTGDTTGWQDTADYDIGDDVPFRLTGTLPSNYADYDTYYYAFHDVEDEGLTFDPTSVKVYVYTYDDSGVLTATTEVGSGYTVVISSNDLTDYSSYSYISKADLSSDGCTFEIVFENLNALYDTQTDPALISVSSTSKIVVEYTSELNENAKIGAEGNDNTVYLVYSNNPNSSGSGSKGTTPEETVTVFTFTLVVNKTKVNPDYDAAAAAAAAAAGETYSESQYVALTGAGFTLYKYVATYDETEQKYTYSWVEIKEIESTDTEPISTFNFVGLDAGRYKISETTTPDGYNTIADVYFTIAAEHEETAADNDDPQLTKLTVTQTDSEGNTLSTPTQTFTVAGTDDNGEAKTGETITGEISADVLNQEGAVMPSTGGMGTKIFYTLGGLLVVCAGVLLIVKRRMRNA